MSYVCSCFHCVFGTKHREPLITPDLQSRLWPYLGGIARENRILPLGIGGVSDHVHLLLSLPSTMAIAKAMQLIKGGSSKWIHDNFLELRSFSWQKEYGAFSVSSSQIDRVVAYIAKQEEHHQTVSFAEEFVQFLEKHRVEYDEKYLWD